MLLVIFENLLWFGSRSWLSEKPHRFVFCWLCGRWNSCCSSSSSVKIYLAIWIEVRPRPLIVSLHFITCTVTDMEISLDFYGRTMIRIPFYDKGHWKHNSKELHIDTWLEQCQKLWRDCCPKAWSWSLPFEFYGENFLSFFLRSVPRIYQRTVNCIFCYYSIYYWEWGKLRIPHHRNNSLILIT